MAGTSEEVTLIEQRLSGARSETVPQVRQDIDLLLGTILARISPDQVMLVEGARILCYLHLHEVENAKGSSASLRIALNSVRQLRRV